MTPFAVMHQSVGHLQRPIWKRPQVKVTTAQTDVREVVKAVLSKSYWRSFFNSKCVWPALILHQAQTKQWGSAWPMVLLTEKQIILHFISSIGDWMCLWKYNSQFKDDRLHEPLYNSPYTSKAFSKFTLYTGSQSFTFTSSITNLSCRYSHLQKVMSYILSGEK